MIFQLAAAADDEALFGHVEPVERAGEMTAVPLIWIKGRRGRQAHPASVAHLCLHPPQVRGRWSWPALSCADVWRRAGAPTGAPWKKTYPSKGTPARRLPRTAKT